MGRDLVTKWQQHVESHKEYDSKLGDCIEWINDIENKLEKAQNLSMLTQAEIDEKINSIKELILKKEEGFEKVQSIVELGQNVLANTSTLGHSKIVDEMKLLQTKWS